MVLERLPVDRLTGQPQFTLATVADDVDRSDLAVTGKTLRDLIDRIPVFPENRQLGIDGQGIGPLSEIRHSSVHENEMPWGSDRFGRRRRGRTFGRNVIDGRPDGDSGVPGQHLPWLQGGHLPIEISSSQSSACAGAESIFHGNFE